MRHHTHTNCIQHKHLKDQIHVLKIQNQKLKKRLDKMENAMHQIYISKKKYKNKYKELKQKLDILQQVYKNSNQTHKIYLENTDYQLKQFNSDSRFQSENAFFRVNKNHYPKKSDLTSNTNQFKQDITSNTLHTLHTMPLSRKSQTKDNLRKNYESRNINQSRKSNSRLKQCGKIFSFKSQQKQRLRFHSSGSEGQTQKPYFYPGQQNFPYQKHNQRQRSPQSPSNYLTTTQYVHQNQGSLKQLIGHLIEQLNSFSKLQNEQNILQKQVKIITTQNLLAQKLQQLYKKLQSIKKNQQNFVTRISQHEQKIIKSFSKKKSEKHIKKSNEDKMSNSFLKQIQQIGKGLTSFQISYESDRK